MTSAFSEATPKSLLDRLRTTEPRREDLERLVLFCSPVLTAWCRRMGVSRADTRDWVHDVLVVLLEKLPSFTYDPEKRFRGWLWTVLKNKVNVARRRQGKVGLAGDDRLERAAGPGGVDEEIERDYRHHLARQALRVMEGEFSPKDVRAFRIVVLEGRPAAEAAKEAGMTVAAVYKAKSRILRRMRQELEGLWE
jgi:RNA polymerase sigma-70 factor (ECF subfamily)